MDEAIKECQAVWSADYEQKVIDIVKRGKTGGTLTGEMYYILRSYKLTSLGGVGKIMNLKDQYMATKESALDIIRQAHISTGHGGERKTHIKISEKYGNIPRRLVKRYIRSCERCIEKQRRSETSAGVIVKPLKVEDLNDRGQVDLVDMQTMKDQGYRYILHYMEYLTKFHMIRPLKSKATNEVARELLFIFLDLGAPHILQSDNGKEFTSQIIRELASLFPEIILVNGRPRHPQSQGSVERGNGDLKVKLTAWMRDNQSSQWSYGIRFVQWAMNSSYHESIKMSPYQAYTGNLPRCGLRSRLPEEFLSKITPEMDEDELEKLLESSSNSGSPVAPGCLTDSAAAAAPAAPGCSTKTARPRTVEDENEQSSTDDPPHPAKRARKLAVQGLEQQAKRMLTRSCRSLRTVNVGDNVAVPVSEFDRGKADPPNVIGVVLEMDETDGYTIGTRQGIIRGKLARNQFEFIQYKGLSPEDISSTVLSLREIVRAQSLCGGQGYRRCHCRSVKSCLSKRCSCLKAGVACNSACHNHRSCNNNGDF